VSPQVSTRGRFLTGVRRTVGMIKDRDPIYFPSETKFLIFDGVYEVYRSIMSNVQILTTP
jgi:hypothetical protein